MRNLNELDRWRVLLPYYGWAGDDTCGAFLIPSPIDQLPMQCIASCDDAWDHVSVSRQKRCPNWPEMDFIKRRFFHDEETVMQLHVATSENINMHSFCLHLWRPQLMEIPKPPPIMVGFK